MGDPVAVAWRCPRCRAHGHRHGRGRCLANLTEAQDCDGFLCHCEVFGFDGPEVMSAEHGKIETNACRNAKCGHCGWSGTYPADGLAFVLGGLDTSGTAFDATALKGWAKEAFDAGWTPPLGWKPEPEKIALTTAPKSGKKKSKKSAKPATGG